MSTVRSMDKPEIEIPDQPPSYQLELEDIEVGDGDEAEAGKVVEVHYVGVSWQNRRQFDASWDRGDTFKFKLGKGEVIPGWDRGVAGMKVGGRRRITIPPDLAYGRRGAGGVIGPGETLAADNVKRVVRAPADSQDLYAISSFLELKTVWHPMGQ